MTREVLSIRVHPLIMQAIKDRCAALRCTPADMVEALVIQSEGANLPPGMRPGERVQGETENDDD